MKKLSDEFSLKSVSITKKYQEQTKHTITKLNATPFYLDWMNQPNPFRKYADAPIVNLPLPKINFENSWPSISQDSIPFDLESLSTILYHSVAISAWKQDLNYGSKWSLRVNPSSGNLHAEEIYIIARGILGLADGIYHFNVKGFYLEKRIIGSDNLWLATHYLSQTDAPLKILITTIVWREAWKYRKRAFRYCLLDAGHVEAALRTAGAQVGWISNACRTFDDESMTSLFGLSNSDEVPLSFIEFGNKVRKIQQYKLRLIRALGSPNKLSETVIHYPEIDEVIRATKLATKKEPLIKDLFIPPQKPASFLSKKWTDLVRNRRSGIQYDGSSSCKVEDIEWMIALSLKQSGYWTKNRIEKEWVDLFVYAHHIEGLMPGIYRYESNSRFKLYKKGDVRNLARKLSLNQSIASNSAFTISMVVNYNEVLEFFGEKGFRLVYQSAGRVGHALYLAAESVGLNATGIGAFFDSDVLQTLSLDDNWIVVYHFTIGKAIPDLRVRQLPGYDFEREIIK
tara:strand:+ start:3512 stop:5047 length:1536 start_codon:yes stop_codon:yes gene_type:complete